LLDRYALARLRPGLHRAALGLAQLGVSANTITLAAFGLGMAACASVVMGYFGVALGLMLVARLADGLDGAVARLGTPTAVGAYLDITLDFLFYAGLPLAFAWHDPAQNALPAATLLAAFMGTGATFLAFATLAARHGLTDTRLPNKGFYYLGGLTEGTETLVCFALMLLWPTHFAWWAYGFAALCALTILTRLWGGAMRLREAAPEPDRP
jgi:phosphatidylglycerophosphate synthase